MAAAANSATADEATGAMGAPPSRLRKIARIAGWSLAFLFFLVVFTLIKLPQDRVRNYVNGTISSALASQGVSFSSGESSISVGYGVSYIMSDVTLSFATPGIEPVRIDKVTVSPSLVAMIFGKIGGDFRIQQGDGLLKGSATVKGAQASVDFTAEKIDLGKMGLIPLLASGIKGTGALNGKGSVSGDFNTPGTLIGTVDLDLAKVRIDAQPLPGGFKLSQPLSISEARIDLDIDKSKATIKTVRVGKAGTNDDIRGTATGDVTLGRNWQASSLNLKTQFSFSDAIRNDFFILDALLKNGKQADGSYSFGFNGPVNNLQTTPPI